MGLLRQVARLERAWNILRVQGPQRFVSAGVGWTRSTLGQQSLRQREYLERKHDADTAFDAAAGVSTGGIQYLHDLTIASRNARFGVNHVAVDPTEFEQAMASVDIDLAAATFVDLGSGLGRAMIMAARYPFAKIIGVEFARELHETCIANLRRAFPAPGARDRIVAVLGDAADFAYPETPLVIYLFNPFDAPIVTAAAHRALASWRADPRPIRIVYLNPVYGELWTDAGWQLVEEGPGRAIFAPPSR